MATATLEQSVSTCSTELLQKNFGFTEFKPGQREVIDYLLAGRSAAAIFPTGGGKSLCYQLPALALPGLTLVVSPLIALMKDQIDALAARGIAARRLDSTLDAAAYREVMDEIRNGKLKLLYVAPERFGNERFAEAMRHVRIALFAVDEAHCISEWGHNFRPDYLRLAQFCRTLKAERLLALTATATPKVLEDICRFFRIERRCAIRTGFYRPNLTLLATPATRAQRERLFSEALHTRSRGATIVYVTLQRTAEELAERLVRDKFAARAYHAGMEDDRRAEIQDWFLGSREGIVVATIAFGMGIDKRDIRYVYHYNPPKSLENYAQEVGRAGRDGEPATCELFFCPDDLGGLENFAYGDTPTREAVQSLVAEVFGQGAEFDLSYYDLSGGHDVRISVVRTLLTYLELDGYLECGTPFYASYQFRPRMPSAEILARFDAARRDFLGKLFAQARRGKTWFSIDLAQACEATGASRDRVVRALDYLAQQEYLELKVAGLRQRYRLKQAPEDLDELATRLHGRSLARETREIGRLREVAAWVEHDGCQVAALGHHFGEDHAEACGHCSWCLRGMTASRLPPRQVPRIDAAVMHRASALRGRYPQILGHARPLARLLCGVSSPALIRAKLQADPLFGVLAEVPFPQVLDVIEGK